MAYFRADFQPDTVWLKCATFEVYLAAIRARKEGRRNWRWVGRDCPQGRPRISDQSLGISGAIFLGPYRG